MPEALATRDAVAEQVGGLRFSYQHFDWGSERYLAHGAIMAEDGPAGASIDSALLGGYHLAFGISAGLVLASIAVAATVVRRTSLFTPAARGVQKAVVRAAGEHPVT
jgi:hypothetical protein